MEETPHPRMTMDDITEVSSTEEIEKRNTIQVAKNTEVRSKTVIAVLLGMVAGFVMFFITVGFLGVLLSCIWIVAGVILAPVLFVSRTNDQMRQVRWRRALYKVKSRNVTGNVFFPNSSNAEDVTHTDWVVFI